MKKLLPIVIAIILFVVIVANLERGGDVESLMQLSDVRAVAHQNAVTPTNQLILDEALKRDDLYYIFGSSELAGFSIPTHPAYMLKDKTPFFIGAGGHQDISSLMKIAASDASLEGKKFVFIISPQWFEHKDGIAEDSFAKWFHKFEALRMLKNANLSSALKAKIASRLMDFATIKQDPSMIFSLLASKVLDADYSAQMQKEYKNAKRILDNAEVLKVPEDAALFDITQPIEAQLSIADKYAAPRCIGNTYYINDEYYNTHIAKKYMQLSGAWRYKTPADSKEYSDFELLLEMLQELKLEPLFIIAPYHGAWCDYTGLMPSVRNLFYQNIRALIGKHKFAIADFASHEYDDYFLTDTMHLGVKGFLYVSHAIKGFYEK